MGRQINKEKVLEQKGDVKNYILFEEDRAPRLDWLLDIYKKDPYKARVLYFNNVGSFYIVRKVVFERTDGSFEICIFKRTFGMTKTNRIYSREKKVSSLIYKNKSFYFKTGSSIKHAMYDNILQNFGFATDFLYEKFKWLRNVHENKYCHNISLSSIVRYKLFNADKILKHIYKAPTSVIKKLTVEYEEKSGGYGYLSKFEWKRISPYLINIENLKLDFLTNYLFRDTVEMAIKLDKKINCSWSHNRLKLEHDLWSKELRNIMLEFEPIIELNPHKIFEDFELFSGYKMLRTNRDLIEEGHKQEHCVAGYGTSISKGECGIYQVSGYTLEVSYRYDYSIGSNFSNTKKLHYSQLRGFKNCSAPKELDDTVKHYIAVFNDSYNFNEYEENLRKLNHRVESVLDDIVWDELPF